MKAWIFLKYLQSSWSYHWLPIFRCCKNFETFHFGVCSVPYKGCVFWLYSSTLNISRSLITCPSWKNDSRLTSLRSFLAGMTYQPQSYLSVYLPQEFPFIRAWKALCWIDWIWHARWHLLWHLPPANFIFHAWVYWVFESEQAWEEEGVGQEG